MGENLTPEDILADLRGRFGPKVILTPDDLAGVIGRSPKAQANMRSRGVFPMPVKKIGGAVGVSIYDLASWLANPEEPAAPLAKASKPTKAKPLARTSTRKSLAAELLGFREAINFYSEVFAALEAWDIRRGLD